MSLELIINCTSRLAILKFANRYSNTNQTAFCAASRGFTPKRATSGGAHLLGLAPGNTAPKKRRSNGEPLMATDLTDPGIEPETFRTDSDVLNDYANRPVLA